ncbi:MAG: hypothetical protein Q4B45_04350 [Coriobacteriia bacterium]|nr:hypothetical protein [Coriobacteriia bacterium]
MSASVAAKIYPTRALQTNLREIKGLADENLVHITENGSAAYVFCSEEVLQRTVDQAVEDELYRLRLVDSVARGEADIAAGNVVVGIDAAFEEADRLAASHG